MSINYATIKQGCSKLFLGLFFYLVSLLSLITTNNETVNNIFSILGILGIVGLILMLIGVKRMRSESKKLGSAYNFLIFSLVLCIAVVVTAIVVGAMGDKLAGKEQLVAIIIVSMTVIADIFMILSYLNLLSGLTDAHEQKGNKSLAKLGKRAKFYYLVPILIAIVVSIITVALAKKLSANVITILSIVSSVCKILGEVTFVIFIARSKNAF